jgi:hypothetical protein
LRVHWHKKRFRVVENSISGFGYVNCSGNYFPIGINQKISDENSFLIASQENTLCDLIAFTPEVSPRFIKSMLSYLE